MVGQPFSALRGRTTYTCHAVTQGAYTVDGMLVLGGENNHQRLLTEDDDIELAFDDIRSLSRSGSMTSTSR